MRLYQLLSGIPFLKKYNSKLMFVAFWGIHIPLLGIIAWLLLAPGLTVSKMSVFLFTLGLTLLATTITLFIVNALTRPLIKTQRTLREYMANQAAPLLPGEFDDELGLLTHDINRLIIARHTAGHEKEQTALMLIRLQELLAELPQQANLMPNSKDAEALEKHIQIIRGVITGQMQQMQNGFIK